jgi:hypothetical protein
MLRIICLMNDLEANAAAQAELEMFRAHMETKLLHGMGTVERSTSCRCVA